MMNLSRATLNNNSKTQQELQISDNHPQYNTIQNVFIQVKKIMIQMFNNLNQSTYLHENHVSQFGLSIEDYLISKPTDKGKRIGFKMKIIYFYMDQIGVRYLFQDENIGCPIQLVSRNTQQ
ncbi:hypothetical protein ABPG72_019968 [Tetrahymena utriculariae]